MQLIDDKQRHINVRGAVCVTYTGDEAATQRIRPAITTRWHQRAGRQRRIFCALTVKEPHYDAADDKNYRRAPNTSP